jgi:Tol biopolymer transport system component
MILRLVSMSVVVLLFASSVTAQQVVFSRRVYSAQGRTYQQLWIWSASDGSMTQLTRSARDHDNPICSADGKQIFFESGTDPFAQSHWRFDRETGIERPVNDAPLRTDRAWSDKSNLRVPQCDERTWSRSPDGSRLACSANGKDVVIVDLGTQKEIDRIPFEQRYSTGEPYPAWSLEPTWSPDGRMLLVGTYGENGSSTVPQLDYFLLDRATKTWTRAMTGYNPVWLPDGHAILYETPRDLVPLPPSGTHSVWSAQLALFDVATSNTQRLTSGLSNNVQPALCPPNP